MPSAPEALRLIPAAAIDRFRYDVEGLIGGDAGKLAVAVSGGPDSMAMLLLAAAAFPGRVIAATVDHGLRAEAADEAALVARHCAAIDVPHEILTVAVAREASVQAAARRARYDALTRWCRGRGAAILMTAHHADDQAETVLMRIARGAGLAGLSSIRARRDHEGVAIIRPLLTWRRDELAKLVEAIETVDDPSNRDQRYDRVQARTLLRSADWIDPLRIAATASHLAEAEAALGWMAEEALRSRRMIEGDATLLDIADLPAEIARRMVAMTVARLDSTAEGPALDHAMERLRMGGIASLGALLLSPGRHIRIEKAPPRR
jgi:tRNA(Ile)-lysidine synthase